MQEEYHERSEVSTVRRTSLGRRTSPYVPVFRCKRPRHGDAAEMLRSDEYESWLVAQALWPVRTAGRPMPRRFSRGCMPYPRLSTGAWGDVFVLRGAPPGPREVL